MRRRWLILALAGVVASASPPATTAAWAIAGEEATSHVLPNDSAALGAIAVSDRTTCEGAIPSVMTNLSGSDADVLEDLQSRYGDGDGFRAVVFDGNVAAIVVAPEAFGAWRARFSNSDTPVVASCVSTGLLDGALETVDRLDVGPDGFVSAGYDALLDAVVVTTSTSAETFVTQVDQAVPGATSGAIADGTLRITQTKPGGFTGLSRGADSAPFWGGARIWTPVAGCTAGFYLSSATNGTVMLTAGHCYGSNGQSTNNGNHTASLGASEGRHIDPDTALIDGQPYFHHTYSWNDQTSHKAITSAANPTTGVVYCQMGATSLRVCSAYSALDKSASYLGNTRHHLAYTSQPNRGAGSSLGSSGDSGGGVYRELSGGVLGARGDVVAGGCDTSTCDRYDTKLQTILSVYDATVITSDS